MFRVFSPNLTSWIEKETSPKYIAVLNRGSAVCLWLSECTSVSVDVSESVEDNKRDGLVWSQAAQNKTGLEPCSRLMICSYVF